jgi:magnesium chelatase family protein
MNHFRVQSALLAGIQAVAVEIECAQARRLPYLQILGGAGAAAGELRERVIAALGTLQGGKFRLPARRFTVEIKPAARGLAIEQLDLAVAVALLGSCGFFPKARAEAAVFFGRLGLDGALSGSLPAAAAKNLLAGRSLVVQAPQFRSLAAVCEYLRGGEMPSVAPDLVAAEAAAPAPAQIWSRISGQALGLRVIEIAAAGAHHLLLPAPAGARADLLAHALSLLLPPLGPLESEEVRAIYALAGVAEAPSRPFHALGSRPELPALLRDRRFRSVEEILLAHRGVLHVPEVVEREAELFPALSYPMEHGALPARVNEHTRFAAADVVVVATTPLCGCGAKGDPLLACSCRPTEARRFETRWRRLLERPFDLFLRVHRERALDAVPDWRGSAARVAVARSRMRERGLGWNARLGEAALGSVVPWEPGASRLREALERREGAGGGARCAALVAARVAVTLCDLREGAAVSEADLLEALHYFPAGAGASGKAARAAVPEVNSIAMP